ncbi:MAG: single-stranded DNA-binding protein [Ruminococcus sp.]|nr:single-stranded DNA-binding protein [Ruminococcus sp.]
MALNYVALLGRITKDLELKSTQSGTSVLQFTVAVDRDFVKQGEERQADFINCVAFKQTAEFISKFFSKGRMIAVEGRLQTRSYDDKNGTKHNVTEVIINKASFTGEKVEQRQEQRQDAPELGGYDGSEMSDPYGIPF